MAGVAAGCGSVTPKQDAAPPIDAALIDTPDPIDAPDAPPPPVAPTGAELGTAGGRMTGATMTLELQLGHPVGQQRIQGATLRLEGNTPVKP